MSKKITWFTVQLELLGISNIDAVEFVKDLQDELNMRPHLRNPKVSWEDKNLRIIVQVDMEGLMDSEAVDQMATEAGDQMAEELLEAASATLRNFKSIHVNVLEVKY